MTRRRNDLLGIGGQRKKVGRSHQSGTLQDIQTNREAENRKLESLAEKMRRRAAGEDVATTQD